MTQAREFRFRIDAYTPETMPMARLAEYMTELALILGEPASVHFVRLEESSTVLVHKIEGEAVPKVEDRVAMLRRGEAPPEAMAAYRRINRRLRQDNGVGILTEDTGTEVIAFPGRDEVQPVTFGAFNQEGNLDGIVIRLGGRQELVPVHLQAGPTIHSRCVARRAVAKRLGSHIFGPELRVHGVGRWYRDEDGSWMLDRFTITDFEVLDDEPLSAVVARLRDIPGSEWSEIDDPWGELDRIRNGPAEVE